MTSDRPRERTSGSTSLTNKTAVENELLRLANEFSRSKKLEDHLNLLSHDEWNPDLINQILLNIPVAISDSPPITSISYLNIIMDIIHRMDNQEFKMALLIPFRTTLENLLPALPNTIVLSKRTDEELVFFKFLVKQSRALSLQTIENVYEALTYDHHNCHAENTPENLRATPVDEISKLSKFDCLSLSSLNKEDVKNDADLILDMMGNKTEVCDILSEGMNSCLTTTDTSLQRSHPVSPSMALAEKHKPSDARSELALLKAIGNVLGIKDVMKVSPYYSLLNLGMDSLMDAEIKEILENDYGIVLSSREIRRLTFGKLKELATGNGESPKPASRSDSTVLSTAKSDLGQILFELSGSEIVPKDTLLKLDTRKSEGTPIFVVSAIEGMVNSFTSLAQELDRPVYGLQCTKNAPLDTITEFAQFNVKHMKEVQKQGPYTLVGYSFGALVAFEMALQLEQGGEQVKLTLVDGSPQYVTQLYHTINKQTEQINKNLEADSLVKTIAFFTRQMNSKITFLNAYGILRGAQNDDEMFKKMVELIGSTPFSPEDLKEAGILFFKKLRAANSYKPIGKYQGSVTLIKAKDNFVSLNSDYGLSQICRQNVKVEELLGNHRSIMAGDSVKKIAELLRA